MKKCYANNIYIKFSFIKEMNKLHTTIALVFIILLGSIYISTRLEVPQKISEAITQNKKTLPPPAVPPQDSSTKSASSATGGSESGSQSSQNPLPFQGCELRTISYGLKNFEKNSICKTYQDTNCIEKTIDCAVSVKNLDYETSGEFEIIFKYTFEDSQETYSTTSETKNVPQRETEKFSNSAILSGADASREITCNFEVGSAPKKEVCF